MFAYVVGNFLAPVSNSSAVTCDNGMVSGTTDICGTDNTDVNVSIEGSWTVSISSAGTLGVNITPTSSGVVNTAVDNVNIYTNTPNGYQLYLSSTSGSTDIYNNSDTQQERNHFTATTGTKASPVSLTSNSWGYSLASSPTTFSKVEASSSASDSLISSGSKTSGTGDNLGVTYGFKADTKLTPGTYTTSVTYTAVAEVPSYTISSISPNNFSVMDTNQPITIITTTPATELGLGTITATITDSTNTNSVNLTNCTETTVTVSGTSYRAASCTYPGGLPVSINNYKVELTSSWHSATYVLNNAVTIYQTTMQNFTQANCTSLTESTAAEDHRTRLKDIRDGKFYNVSKLADGNCWMVQNLALDGGRTLTAADSNVTTNRSLTANITNGTISVYDTPQIYSGKANETTTNCGSYPYCVISNISYGNYYNWNAATATVGKQNTVSTITESVCPKGWRLPDDTGVKSYTNLLYAYDLPTTETIDGNAVRTVQQSPLYFSLNSFYNNAANSSRSAYYWSRTVANSSTDKARYFAALQDGHIAIWGIEKTHGFGVRCVFGE